MLEFLQFFAVAGAVGCVSILLIEAMLMGVVALSGADEEEKEPVGALSGSAPPETAAQSPLESSGGSM